MWSPLTISTTTTLHQAAPCLAWTNTASYLWLSSSHFCSYMYPTQNRQRKPLKDKSDHPTPLLKPLQWFLNPYRVKSKLFTKAYIRLGGLHLNLPLSFTSIFLLMPPITLPLTHSFPATRASILLHPKHTAIPGTLPWLSGTLFLDICESWAISSCRSLLSVTLRKPLLYKIACHTHVTPYCLIRPYFSQLHVIIYLVPVLSRKM